MYKNSAILSVFLCAMAVDTACTRPWIELKPSYFFFSNHPMKDLYSKGGFEIQGALSVPCINHFSVYSSVGYRKAQGKSLSSHEKTTLIVVPVDIGLKPIFNFYEWLYCFFAIGPRYFYFRQHNNSSYVSRVISGSGVGFFVNAGCEVLRENCFLLGAFGEYSYEKKTIYPQMPNVYSAGALQMGGFAFGVSVGYVF